MKPADPQPQPNTSPLGYLGDLMLRLAEGLRGWDPARADRQRGFLLRLQQPDGGFAGRAAGSDLYYTSFAVRALLLLDALSESVCGAVADYLKRWFAQRSERGAPVELVDYVSRLQTVALLVLVLGEEVLARVNADLSRASADFEAFRAPDGGYARTRAARAGSTYHTFLVAVCYELLGEQPPNRDVLVDFALSRRRADGGFVEVAPARRGGSNPTAAAAALLQRFGGMTAEVRDGIREYLTAVRDRDGGFRANLRVPAADLLSTFTLLTTADSLGLHDVVAREATVDFVEGLALPNGGYRGGVWETDGDVEYTFYGLGSVALLRTWDAAR